MNTTIEQQKTAPRPTTNRVRRSTAVPTAPVAPTEEELLVKRPSSELTRLVFMAILGCAACIALVGVVSEANDPAIPGTSPDAPPPAVIID